MAWSSTLAFAPSLPAHCEPTNDFLLRFSSAFHTCVPTPLAFTSSALGSLSIIAWLFAQLPQIYKNYSISSTSGLSIFFLVEWCLGDVGNLFGALFTHQASWQVAIGAYYVFVDLCLVAQWLWYEKLRHGVVVRRAWTRPGYRGDDARSGGMEEVVIEGIPGSPAPATGANGSSASKQAARTSKQASRPQVIFRAPTFQSERRASEEKASSSSAGTPTSTTIHRPGPSTPLPSPSPRTILLLACLLALAQASPLSQPTHHPSHSSPNTQTTSTPLETLGTALAWLSTTLYLLSRLPQLLKNHRRKSTAGLSPHLFLAAFSGNLFYSAALLTNPCAWADYPAFGAGGWVGAQGSERRVWGMAALPFFLGAAGVLGLDASVGLQFWVYGGRRERVVVVVEVQEGGEGERGWRGRHWRRVSGWMRGWVPVGGEGKEGREGEGLLGEGGGEGYGTGA
ncbi:hypothetical protein LTR59_017987 [Friedmanniomyces endolithicus]|nr:hypothetical protein LTR59_017987 [Friedmanniomyces endolithicus]KAK0770027.1 hypothetical protein LTR38_017711 [Friedmanniomyces endolithicus]KAK0771765.1 hypothetical protein LTR75_017595 [Friedmanniomyces endolithicus]KAK0861698.1 hypothetical protein LTR87_016869 [Friedmanniomyces endolithicus]